MIKKFRSYLGKVFLLSLIGLVILIWPRPAPQLTAYFFDVGQGDSELFVMPGGQTVLVDGGPSFGLVAKLDQILPLTHRQIDLLVLTHPHDDHLIGLLEVLRIYPVKEVLITGVSAKTLAWQAFSRLLAAKQIRVTRARGGLQWQFIDWPAKKLDQPILPAGNRGPPTLTVVYPLIDISKQYFTDLNDSSIVLRLDYGQSSALLMGDLPAKQETQLIQGQIKWRAQVLKVGHHGSSYSSSLQFLQAVKPVWSIISCGLHNLFHHPSQATIARLQAVGNLVLITKDTGQVILQTSGQGQWQRVQGTP